MDITNIDHIVLTVKDIEQTIKFYVSVLGMVVESFGEERKALKFGNQKINLHKYGNEFEPKADHPTPGSADLCFLINTNIKEAMKHVKGKGVKIIEGPVLRKGARGSITSFYFRDPDQNLIEIAKSENIRFCTVINCMDGRIQLPVINYLKRRFNVEYVDSITEAGPNLILTERKETDLINSIFRRLQASINNHNSVGIAIVGHYDCAGNPAPKEKQIQHIHNSIQLIRQKTKDREVIGLWLDNSFKITEIKEEFNG